MTDNKRLLPGSLSDEDALTCDDPITAFIARLSVSKVHDELTDFVNAEIHRPEANVNHILIGMAAYMVQMHASLAASFFDVEMSDSVAAQFQAVFDRTYREHFVDSAKELAA